MLCLLAVAGIPNAQGVFLFAFFPLGSIFSFLCVLCFFFTPYKVTKEANSATLAAEIDEQFKFSRTVCVSVGVLLLTYLLYKVIGANFVDVPAITGAPPAPIDPGIFFWIAYISCLIHLCIFVAYIMFRNMREESLVRVSLFQITFFTMAILLGVVLSCTKIGDQYDYINSCQDIVQYTDASGSETAPAYGCASQPALQAAQARIQSGISTATSHVNLKFAA